MYFRILNITTMARMSTLTSIRWLSLSLSIRFCSVLRKKYQSHFHYQIYSYKNSLYINQSNKILNQLSPNYWPSAVVGLHFSAKIMLAENSESFNPNVSEGCQFAEHWLIQLYQSMGPDFVSCSFTILPTNIWILQTQKKKSKRVCILTYYTYHPTKIFSYVKIIEAMQFQVSGS